jgi:hypothetical protein
MTVCFHTFNDKGDVMITEISLILSRFRDCFSRTAAFNWFVIVIMGFILRLDHHGVSSMIRWLGLRPSLYKGLLSFFITSSWHLKGIQQRWWQIVLSHCPVLTVAGRHLIVGDGIKVSKEAQKMPGVKKLHQESEKLATSTITSCRFGLQYR